MTSTCPLVSILLRWIGRKMNTFTCEKLENHHGFGRRNSGDCVWLSQSAALFLTKRWSVPCSPVLVLPLLLHSLWDWTRWVLGSGKGHRVRFHFCWLPSLCPWTRSSLSAKLPRVRDFSEPCLPFKWHLHLLLKVTLARWCVLKAQGMLSYF